MKGLIYFTRGFEKKKKVNDIIYHATTDK
jgi:hypothetical protein